MNNDVELEVDFIEAMLARHCRDDRIYSPLIYLRDTKLIYNTGGKVHMWLGGTVNQNNHVPDTKIRKIKPDYFTGCILFMHRRSSNGWVCWTRTSAPTMRMWISASGLKNLV